MARQVTRWSPDTCGCVIDLEWDDTQPEATRQHTPIQAQGCPHHRALATPADVGAIVTDENRRKNHTLAALADEGFTSGVQWTFIGEGTRALRVSLPNRLDASDGALLLARVKARAGDAVEFID